ncbi:aldehyde dehydrogenase family protein [Azoarcus sp. TTM-91]|uniref:aldehyde dehydrogenase family protein n=1 Tax=Azoarcus sp. TTM-91 TaxID=2691581 RepID=UPI001B7D1A54|nr:aldehyde dehydrogenase family protein [Azoarcus sp. TTM-91]
MNAPDPTLIAAIKTRLAAGPQPMLIGGEWTLAASGQTFDSRDPATGELVATVARAGSEDIDRAVAAARAAFDGPWGRMRPAERQRILLRLADLVEANFEELCILDTLDMGAPIRHTRGAKDWLLGLLRYYAGMATALYGQTVTPSTASDLFACTVREPVGVVGAIVPWNGPLIASIWKAGPVLATGCTLVLKPSEEAPLSPLRFAELALEAGLPPGVLNVVPGYGHDAGAALAAHPGVDKIAFTGSVPTAQAIMRAAAGNLKRLSLELGGKSPNIVFADADLEAAVPAATWAAFANAGQVCSAGTRLFVERAVHDDFVAGVARYAAGLKVGPGLDPATEIGPLVSPRQLERVRGYVAAGQEEGARLLAGGDRPAGAALAAGNYLAPTVFGGVADHMRIAREEIFGPVLAAMPFDSAEEVLARANASPYGLGAGVWTRDVGRAHAFARRLQSGSVWINCYNVLDPALPFGGYKMSGFGHESGTQQLEEYMQVKGVWIAGEMR